MMSFLHGLRINIYIPTWPQTTEVTNSNKPFDLENIYIYIFELVTYVV